MIISQEVIEQISLLLAIERRINRKELHDLLQNLDVKLNFRRILEQLKIAKEVPANNSFLFVLLSSTNSS